MRGSKHYKDPRVFATHDKIKANIAKAILEHTYKRTEFYIVRTKLKTKTRYEVKLRLKQIKDLTIPVSKDLVGQIRQIVERV